MAVWNLLVCLLAFATAPVQSKVDPWMQDPILVGLWKLTRAINSFGLDLFKDVSIDAWGSVLVGPYSVSNPLGILQFGSAGETEEELTHILSYDEFNLTKEEAAQAFYLLSTKHLKSSNPKFYTFDSPSTILVNRENGLSPTFQRTVEVLFQAPITVSDFWSKEVVKSVNDWVAARTRNKIKRVLQEIDPHHDLIVVNAAYFKGAWVHKFPADQTEINYFYNHGSETETSDVPLMRMLNVLNFHQDQHHSVLELPFRGRNVSMIFLLPHELDGFDALMNAFSAEFLEDQISKMRPHEVDVVLPRFKLKVETNVRDYIMHMGVTTLFLSRKVDLSDMIRRDSVFVGDIRHKAVISVTEGGVEVGAPTAVSGFKPVVHDTAPDFFADHPFLFVIYERNIKLVLFVGSVVAF